MLSNYYIAFIINKNRKVIFFYGSVWVEESECIWQNFQNKKRNKYCQIRMWSWLGDLTSILILMLEIDTFKKTILHVCCINRCLCAEIFMIRSEERSKLVIWKKSENGTIVCIDSDVSAGEPERDDFSTTRRKLLQSG